MDGSQFNKMFGDTVNTVASELRKTSIRYGSAENVLENLDLTSSLLDMDPRQAHTAALTKHLVAVISMGKSKEITEPQEWEEILTKLLVDIFLLKAVVVVEHNTVVAGKAYQELKQP